MIAHGVITSPHDLRSTAKLEALSGTVGPVRLALVERGVKPEARKVIPVRAKDVLLSVAEVEREER